MAVTDLTGTKWFFNSSLNVPAYFDASPFSIDFSSNGLTFSSMRWEILMTTMMYYTTNGDWTGTRVYSNKWSNEAYRTIEITGGKDATNVNLISWLQSNATQITEQPNTFSIGNLPIANMYFGTRQVKKIYMGNALVWEKEETGYTVTLNCGGGSSYTKGSVHVYDSTYEDISSSNLIFSQDSIDLSAYPVTLTVKSGHCTVAVESSGAFMGSYLTSSDFTTSHGEGTMTKEFVVDKNGTIEFGADDWDD